VANDFHIFVEFVNQICVTKTPIDCGNGFFSFYCSLGQIGIEDLSPAVGCQNMMAVTLLHVRE